MLLVAGSLSKSSSIALRIPEFFSGFFLPTFITKGFQLSLRLHHKVVLADGEVAIIGGMNFANRYHGTPEKKEWLDFAVLIRGPECVHILVILKKLVE